MSLRCKRDPASPPPGDRSCLGSFPGSLRPRNRASLRQRRTAGPFAANLIPHVLQIFDSDFARVEAVAGHVPEKREKRHTLAELRILLCILPECNQVQHFLALLRRAAEIRIAVMIDAIRVQPHKPPAEFQLVLLVFAGKKIDELRSEE